MIKQMSLYDALNEHPECKSLILHKTSGMGGILNFLEKNHIYDRRFAKHAMVWLYFQNEQVVAWSWLFQKRAQGVARQLSFFVFCNHKVRKKGIGKELFYLAQEAARKKHRRMLVYPWSYTSEEFYNYLKVPKRNQVDWVS